MIHVELVAMFRHVVQFMDLVEVHVMAGMHTVGNEDQVQSNNL
jgi:hypothetical protein